MIEQPNKAAFFFESSNIMLNKSPVYQYDIWVRQKAGIEYDRFRDFQGNVNH